MIFSLFVGLNDLFEYYLFVKETYPHIVSVMSDKPFLAACSLNEDLPFYWNTALFGFYVHKLDVLTYL